MGRPRSLTNRKSDQVTVRLPEGMRDELNRLALANDRKANGEIVNRLKRSLDPTLSPEYEALSALLMEELGQVREQLELLRKEVAGLKVKK